MEGEDITLRASGKFQTLEPIQPQVGGKRWERFSFSPGEKAGMRIHRIPIRAVNP
jgi:hypothetical protein